MCDENASNVHNIKLWNFIKIMNWMCVMIASEYKGVYFAFRILSEHMIQKMWSNIWRAFILILNSPYIFSFYAFHQSDVFQKTEPVFMLIYSLDTVKGVRVTYSLKYVFFFLSLLIILLNFLLSFFLLFVYADNNIFHIYVTELGVVYESKF